MSKKRKLWDKTRDGSAANEFTGDHKFGWLMVGCPAVKERDLRRSERRSILPAYTKDGVYGLEDPPGAHLRDPGC
jgi:hypothetical protein